MADENDNAAGYASPPCLMHELDPAYTGLVDPRQHADVMRWRKAERQRLLRKRRTIGSAMRGALDSRIVGAVADAICDVRGLTISAYWPIRGEPDLRALMGRVTAGGGQCALPVVVERNRPLIFRRWVPGERLERGFWNIPIPVDGDEVVPDLIIAPVVGFDQDAYRLGYGGGYFDRTLAGMPHRPRCLGVGYAQAAIATIYPQPHDIPMDTIITENDIVDRKTDGSGNK